MGHFIDELKRRNVVRVGVAYIVVSWLAIQVGEVVLPTFGAPEWVFKTIMFLVVLGFPFALILAWAFEITPDGVKKTRDVDASASITPSTGRKLNAVIIASLTVALVYFVWESRFAAEPAPPPEAAIAETAVPDTQEEPAQGPEKSIAVLPFDDLSPDSDHAWFADGLAEEILNSLARAPDLLVAARTSSFAYKGTTKDVPTIAVELGVEHVLEGSVRRNESRLRVTAQLIRASDGFHLWSETYDRSVADMIEIQENVAIEIARALQTAMDPEALGRMLSAGTRSIPAYEAYLEGLAFGISTVSTGDMYEYVGALDAFERAVELDPEFGEGYLQLAYFWSGQLNTANIEYGFLAKN
ncbi:MAG: adenylyl cyclase, partial [Gammaproteobacteria bacterium]|nr:adenylyl cyclase [Gammaproteobacteria bacterium]